jgi:kynurenine formamidase
MVRPDGGSAANDIIVMGTHVGTHIDALAHVSHDGVLHGGGDAAAAQRGGRFDELGVHAVAPFIGRGVLLDIPAVRGGDRLAAGEEVTVEDVTAAEALLPRPIAPGDGVLLRTGWGANWELGDPYVGKDTGVPGPGPAAAEWVATRRPAFVGADTIAFERIPSGAGHAVLPVHRILLVEHGINIVETLALEELAGGGHREFVLILIPLPLLGATGSPVRPLAIVPRS